ncbi:MAG: hypothetical protein ACFCD0_11030 [Gemmataceae bacterium]
MFRLMSLGCLLATILSSGLCWAQDRTSLTTPTAANANQSNTKLQKDLLQPIASAKFENTPLLEVIQDIVTITGIPFEFDTSSLTKVGRGLATPVTLNVSNISTKSALRLILNQNSMDYLLEDSQVVITSKHRVANEMIWRSYPISDLVSTVSIDSDEESSRYEAIQTLVQQAISPGSWREVGGRGRLTFECGTTGMELTVFQNRANQERTAEFLQVMRQIVPTTTIAEIRPFRMRTCGLLRTESTLGLQFQTGPNTTPPSSTSYVCLNPKQLRKFIEAACSAKGTTFDKVSTKTFSSDSPVSLDVLSREEFVTGFETVIHAGNGRCVPKKETFEVGEHSRIQVSGNPKSGSALIDFSWKTVEVTGRRPFPLTVRVPQKNGDSLAFVEEQHILTKPSFQGATVQGLVSVPTGTTLVAVAPVRSVEQHNDAKSKLQTVSWRVLTPDEEKACCEEVTEYAGLLITVKQVGREGFSTKFLEDIGYFSEPVATCETPKLEEVSTMQEDVASKVENLQVKSFPHQVIVDDFRTPVPAPLPKGASPKCDDVVPDLASIIRAMSRSTTSIPFLHEVSQEDFDYTVELLAEDFSPPRFYPCIGPARLHTCHFKCTVWYTETTKSAYPFPFESKRRKSEVIYMDRNRLFLVQTESEPEPEQEQEQDPIHQP